jgi:hypothetical protein
MELIALETAISADTKEITSTLWNPEAHQRPPLVTVLSRSMHPKAPYLISPRRMMSSGLLRRVALVRTDVSEEPGASFIRVTKIGERGTTQAVTSNRRTLRRNTWYFFLMKEAPGSSETSVLTRATRRNNPEDTILHCVQLI